jgi:hypothetical protein
VLLAPTNENQAKNNHDDDPGYCCRPLKLLRARAGGAGALSQRNPVSTRPRRSMRCRTRGCQRPRPSDRDGTSCRKRGGIGLWAPLGSPHAWLRARARAARRRVGEGLWGSRARGRPTRASGRPSGLPARAYRRALVLQQIDPHSAQWRATERCCIPDRRNGVENSLSSGARGLCAPSHGAPSRANRSIRVRLND